MKVSGMLSADLEMAPLSIDQLEQRGYHSAFSAEINNDPFLPLVQAAAHSKDIRLTTSIAVALPMRFNSSGSPAAPSPILCGNSVAPWTLLLP